MKPTTDTATALGVAFGAIVVVVASLCVEAWLLGMVLSWFGVALTFWQNLVIIVLANMITGGSSK